jgi:hypothetical protein
MRTFSIYELFRFQCSVQNLWMDFFRAVPNCVRLLLQETTGSVGRASRSVFPKTPVKQSSSESDTSERDPLAFRGTRFE